MVSAAIALYGGLSALLGGGSLIIFITYPLDKPSSGMHTQYIGKVIHNHRGYVDGTDYGHKN